ncbi:MAG: helix-turn-helix transcriptional regulator [Flavobacteriales bacterium]|nr:helix-turn-helix transcriptional regulator [Flavobacteriales bacterium]
MEINDRISEIITYYELTPTEFANKLDIQRSSVSHLTSGRNKPSVDFIQKLAIHFPKINLDWFVSGKGEMIKTESTQKINLPSPTLSLFPELENQENQDHLTKNNENKQIKHLNKLNKTKQNIENENNESKKSSFLIDSKFNQEISNTKNKKKLKKIILIYSDDSFESFEN